ETVADLKNQLYVAAKEAGIELHEDISDEVVRKALDNAFYVHTVLELGVDYEIDGATNRIFLTDKNTGEQTTRQLGEGRHAALHAKHAQDNGRAGSSTAHPVDGITVQSAKSMTSNKRPTRQVVEELIAGRGDKTFQRGTFITAVASGVVLGTAVAAASFF
ncbi:MAG: hypothetical protein COV67_13200, partial [Nitrospinae bacterium CG11_big_fil_rev_8_21_14_0_20_56_8]